MNENSFGVPSKTINPVLNWVQDSNVFNPNNINGLKIFLDMMDDSTIRRIGTTLTFLQDKSGNYNHSIPTGTARGTIAMDGALGTQVLQLDGTANYLPLSYEVSNSSYTAFIVVKNTSNSTTKHLMAGTSVSFDLISTSLGKIQMQNTVDGGSRVWYNFNNSLLDYTVFSIRKKAGQQIKIFINGANQYNPTYLTSFAEQKIGRLLSSNSGFFVPGGFGSFLYYDNDLTDLDHLSVIKYLYDRHNLSAVPKILCFGDSITEGNLTPYANNWAPVLSGLLGIRERNVGISGTPLQSAGNFANFGYGRFLDQLVEVGINDRIYCLYGTNDVGGVATGGSVAAFQAEYGSFIANLLSKGRLASNIWLGSPPRRTGDSSSALNQQYGAAVAAVASTYGCHFADIYAAFVAGGGDTLMADALHPNAAGHTLIANTFLAAP
jgi:lysophospholipase L1-like esterase